MVPCMGSMTSDLAAAAQERTSVSHYPELTSFQVTNNLGLIIGRLFSVGLAALAQQILTAASQDQTAEVPAKNWMAWDRHVTIPVVCSGNRVELSTGSDKRSIA